jgi:hypothetical protein
MGLFDADGAGSRDAGFLKVSSEGLIMQTV